MSKQGLVALFVRGSWTKSIYPFFFGLVMDYGGKIMKGLSDPVLARLRLGRNALFVAILRKFG